MGELVMIDGKNIYTTSLIISENLNLKHDNVVALLKKHSDIDELSMVQTDKLSTKGRAFINYLLNEEQALILVSLMKNSKEVIAFKVKLVKEFIKNRKLLQQIMSQRQNAEYMLERQQGKLIRKETTDTIKLFTEYAVKQGSTSAIKYYMSLTKMENKVLFLITSKFPNLRDVLDRKQLHVLKCADMAIEEALIDGMEKGMDYHDIYKLAKEKVIAITSIYPPSPLQALLSNDSTT